MAVIYHMRYPLRFRQVEDILHERGIDIFHETVRCLDGHLWSSISEQRWTTSKGEAHVVPKSANFETLHNGPI